MRISVYDIGPDKELDRYTVIIDGSVFGMSDNPFHPTYGFCQYCGDLKSLPGAKRGKCIRNLYTLPGDVRKAIAIRAGLI